MDVRSQDAVGELDHCVAEVDDGMAWKWLNVTPLGIFARWKDLQAAESVEEDCDAAEIGVLTQCQASVVNRLWWCFDKPTSFEIIHHLSTFDRDARARALKRTSCAPTRDSAQSAPSAWN